MPAIRSLPTLVLDTPVTILVGENGCGKSTLLEAVAGNDHVKWPHCDQAESSLRRNT